MGTLIISGCCSRQDPAASSNNMLIRIKMIPGIINHVFRNRPPLRLTIIIPIKTVMIIRCIAMSVQNAGTAFSGLAPGIMS